MTWGCLWAIAGTRRPDCLHCSGHARFRRRVFPCHAEAESHPARQWPRDAGGEHAILCGVCRTELTIDAYRATDECPACGAAFNPGCRLHAHLYFED